MTVGRRRRLSPGRRGQTGRSTLSRPTPSSKQPSFHASLVAVKSIFHCTVLSGAGLQQTDKSSNNIKTGMSETLLLLLPSLSLCVCPPSRLYHVSTARRISLGGEGNALHPVLSSCKLVVSLTSEQIRDRLKTVFLCRVHYTT